MMSFGNTYYLISEFKDVEYLHLNFGLFKPKPSFTVEKTKDLEVDAEMGQKQERPFIKVT